MWNIYGPDKQTIIDTFWGTSTECWNYITTKRLEVGMIQCAISRYDKEYSNHCLG